MKYGKKEMQEMPGGGRLYNYMQAGGKLGVSFTTKDGEEVSFGDGGKMRGYKMGQEGMEIEEGNPEVGDRKPFDVFVDNGQFYQVTRKGTGVKRMTSGDIFNFLDDSEALVIPTGTGNITKDRNMARNAIASAIAEDNMDLLSDYVKPGFKGIEGFAVRAEAMKGEGPTDTEVFKGAYKK